MVLYALAHATAVAEDLNQHDMAQDEGYCVRDGAICLSPKWPGAQGGEWRQPDPSGMACTMEVRGTPMLVI
jgi:hypothetical protein